MSPENEALELIPSIYRACVDDAGLQECTNHLSSRLHVPVGWLLHTPAPGTMGQIHGAMAGVEPFAPESWKDEYREQDLAMLTAHRAKSETIFLLEELLSPAELDTYKKSEFFNEWIVPVGAEGSHLFFFNFKERWPQSSFYVARYLDGGRPLSGPYLDLLKLLLPHIKSATNVWRNVRSEHSHAVRTVDAMDLLPTGVVFVGSDGSVVHTNKAARHLFVVDDGIDVRCGTLSLKAHDANCRLSQLISACTAAGNGRSLATGGALTVPRASGKRPYEIFVSPLFGKMHADIIEIPAAAIVFITDPGQQITPPEKVLGTLYSLTPSESRLAIALANDFNLTEAADRLGVTIGTARVMLKRLFCKTGTHRQASLVRLLNHGPLSMFTDVDSRN